LKPIPLFGEGVRSISDIVTRQRRVNCFYILRKDSDRSNVIILGSPGSFAAYTLDDGPIRGYHVAGTSLYVVAGTTLFEVSISGGITQRGVLPTVSRLVGMADNGIDLIVVDGVSGYVMNLTTKVITTVTDTNFPFGCTTIAYINERYVAETPDSRIFTCSAQLDGTSWTPYLFATKEDYSDNIQAVDVFNGLIILWGENKSIEFWQDAGLFPLPYQKVVGATQTWGLAAKYSRTVIGNTIAFLGKSPDGGVQVLRLNGVTPVRISTDDIENEIRKFSVYSDAISLTYTVNGHSFLQITFPSAQRTFLFDAATNVWSEAQTGLGVVSRHYANLGVSFNGKNYFSDSTSGVVYQFDLDTYTDNGTPILREVCTRHIRNAGNEISLQDLYLDMEVGVGNVDDPTPQVSVAVSKDGGKNFGTEKIRSLGAVGQYLKRIYFSRLGSGKDFVLRIRMTDPVKFVIASGSATVEDNSVS